MNEKPQDGITRPLDKLVIRACYGCGKPATKASEHWQDARVCDECDDWQSADDYDWHCTTGQ